MHISELEELLSEFLPEEFTIKSVKGQVVIFSGLKENLLTGELLPIESEEDCDEEIDEEEEEEVPDFDD